MKRLIVLFVLLISMSFCHEVFAQKVSISTNLVDYANLGTINGEVGVSVAQHWTIHGGAKYNSWRFEEGTPDAYQNNKRTFYLGPKFWFWHAYSGWWISAQAQYQEYNHGGWIFGEETEEGDAWGLGLSAGYTLMLSSWFNLDFGVGGWGGYTNYVTYACPECGRITDKGYKYFFLPNSLMMSAVFVF